MKKNGENNVDWSDFRETRVTFRRAKLRATNAGASGRRSKQNREKNLKSLVSAFAGSHTERDDRRAISNESSIFLDIISPC